MFYLYAVLALLLVGVTVYGYFRLDTYIRSNSVQQKSYEFNENDYKMSNSEQGMSNFEKEQLELEREKFEFEKNKQHQALKEQVYSKHFERNHKRRY